MVDDGPVLKGGLPPPFVPSGGIIVFLLLYTMHNTHKYLGGLPAPMPSGGGLPPPVPEPQVTAAPIPQSAVVAVPADDGLGKYRKMAKMSVPKAAIINKMKQDKIDSGIIMKYELTGNLPAAPSSAPNPAPAPIPVAAVVDDGLDKFRKMLKMKVPKAAIVNKMRQDKVDNGIIMKFELTGNLPQSSGGLTLSQSVTSYESISKGFDESFRQNHALTSCTVPFAHK